MVDIRTFGSVEEMFEEIRKDREFLDARIQDLQREVKPGDFIVCVSDGFGGEKLVAYSQIVDPIESERQYYDLNDPEQAKEFAWFCEQYGPEWQKSYVFGQHFSPYAPEGEYSQLHRVSIHTVITKEMFEKAKELGWPQIAKKKKPGEST